MLINKYIRKQRKIKGLTQKQVADFCGMKNYQQIANIELCNAPIPVKHLKKLAKCLSLTKEEIKRLYLETVKEELDKEF